MHALTNWLVNSGFAYIKVNRERGEGSDMDEFMNTTGHEFAPAQGFVGHVSGLEL